MEREVRGRRRKRDIRRGGGGRNPGGNAAIVRRGSIILSSRERGFPRFFFLVLGTGRRDAWPGG